MDGGSSRLRPRCGLEPSLGRHALGDPESLGPSYRGDERLEEPLAREHPAPFRCPTCRRGDGEGGGTGDDCSSDALRPGRRPSYRRGRAGPAPVRTPSSPRCALARRPTGALSAPPREQGDPGVSAAAARAPGRRDPRKLEARFRAFLDRFGLPRPRLNAWLTVGSHRYQVDCLWPQARVIVELDGFATHGTRSAFESDRDRDRRLAAAGYRSTRVTWRQLEDIPEEIAIDFRTLLAADYKRP